MELAMIVALSLLSGASLTALQACWRARRRLERRLAESAQVWPVWPEYRPYDQPWPVVVRQPVQYPAVPSQPVRRYWPHEVRYPPNRR
ncbi:hypothetical protein [Amycolatopsis sulphurea]|nr:hypothetical protein [Amycolatopsis sulphurea]